MHKGEILHRTPEDCDSLDALEIVEEFNALLKEVKGIYEENEIIRRESDDKILDLLHYAELHENLNASAGFRVYKLMADVRRERRRCKNENELLEPLLEFVKANPKLLNDVGTLLGRLRGTKRCIDQRVYTTRTDVI